MRIAIAFLLLSSFALAQGVPTKKSAKPPVQPSPSATKAKAGPRGFARDVVNMALALPQGDRQDRLRVINSALAVLATTDKQAILPLAREAVRIESELVAEGEEPVVSVLASGYADCKAAAEFAQTIYPQNIAAAEQSLIGALTRCPKHTTNIVQSRIDAAIEQGAAPPRLVMAAVDVVGAASPWSQEKITKLFDALPDPKANRKEAANYAAMYEQNAAKVERGVARTSGIKLLEWLGKVEPSPDRFLATTITLDAMKKSLGEQAFTEALERSVMARQAAENPGEPGEIEHEEVETASAEEASRTKGAEGASALKQLPSSMRARQAAANGFSVGTAGDRDSAATYFDIAFSAADEVWAARKNDAAGKRAAEVLEEVAEAAAHVDAVSALKRAQNLSDPTAQAISMIAVARVVASGPENIADGDAPRPR